MSDLKDFKIEWRDRLWFPVRAVTLEWNRLVQSKEPSIADLDISIADLMNARVTAVMMVGALLVSGSGLIWLHAHLIETSTQQGATESILSLLASHFGIAFVVAALAAIGFEVFAHYHKLQQQIYTLFRINHRVAELQLDAVMQKLLPNRAGDDKIHQQLRNHFSDTIHSIVAMDATGTSTVALHFISTLLRYTRDASHTLQMVAETDNPHELRLPESAAALADEILASQLRVLGVDDKYYVVSDFSTWHDWQLHQFWEALNTTNKPIEVCRVFCKFEHDKKNICACEAKEILRRHWERAGQLAKKDGQHIIYNVGVSNATDVEHIGLFIQGDAHTCFKPHGRGRLTSLTVSHENAQARFDDAWSDAIKFKDSADKLLPFADLLARLESLNYFDGFAGCADCAKLHFGDPCGCPVSVKSDRNGNSDVDAVLH